MGQGDQIPGIIPKSIASTFAVPSRPPPPSPRAKPTHRALISRRRGARRRLISPPAQCTLPMEVSTSPLSDDGISAHPYLYGEY